MSVSPTIGGLRPPSRGSCASPRARARAETGSPPARSGGTRRAAPSMEKSFTARKTRERWEQEQREKREQEKRAAKQAELEAYLRDRGREWSDTTGDTPTSAMLEKWRAEFMDTKQLIREAEHAERLARAEAEYDF